MKSKTCEVNGRKSLAPSLAFCESHYSSSLVYIGGKLKKKEVWDLSPSQESQECEVHKLLVSCQTHHDTSGLRLSS